MTYWTQIIAVGGRVLAEEKDPGDNLSNRVLSSDHLAMALNRPAFATPALKHSFKRSFHISAVLSKHGVFDTR